jgi:response regulator RpfG family c-di-GMP phosphodiesterase
LDTRPDINGYQVCKSLKSRKTTSAIPVVMVTARIAAENRLESFCAGADDYIPKPYTPDQIFQAMADADAWRRHLERHDFEGEIRIETPDEGESLRHLAQFRSLLLSQTPLDLDTVGQLSSALQEIWRDAVAWGRAHRFDLVATLSYRVQADRLALTLRDASGWLGDDHLAPEDRWPKAFPPVVFDEITPVESEHRISFLKRFPPGDLSANS